MTAKRVIKKVVYSVAIVVIIMITAMLCVAIFDTDSADAKKSLFKNGNGTANSPYQVSTAEEFNAISNHPEAYYVQTANIDFTDKEFYPVGDYSHPFTGYYNGNKYLLSGINSGSVNADFAGVFTFIYSGGVVENVRVENSRFVAKQNVGAIAGLNAGKIEGCVANAEVFSDSNASGGIAGANSGVISLCVNMGNVEAAQMYAGGICGVNSGIVRDSYNKGNVSATVYTGGIAGINNGENAVIERAFQIGKVNGTAVANIAGDNMKATIKQCRFVEGSGLKRVTAFDSGKVYSSIARPQADFKSGRAFSDWQNFNNNFKFVNSLWHPILQAEYVEVNQIKFEQGNSIKLRPGESVALEGYTLPSHASVKDVTLSIESGEKYCSLKDGVVTVKEDAEVGEYINVIGQAEGVVGVFTIEIIPIRVEKISLSSEDGKLTVAPGAELNFYTNVYPSNASIKDVRYITSSPFADIDAYGRMKVSLDAAIGLQITVIAASYDNIKIEDSLTIEVVEAQVKSVEVANQTRNFKVTQNLELSGIAVTESLSTDNVEFEIVDEGTTAVGARIIGNKLYADLPGNICVVAKYAHVKSAPVLFVAQEEPVTKAVFRNANSFTIDSTLNLIVETYPENATYGDVEFSIVGENNVGAQLDGNRLTAKSAGTVIVKAQSVNGVYATQTIYARSAGDNSIAVTDICLEKDSFIISRSLTLVPVVEPREAQATVFFEIFSDGGTGVELVDGKLQNAQREGSIILKAYTLDYHTFLTIDAKKVEVENVYFANANRFKVTRGLELAVTTNPSNPTYPQVEYEIVSSTAEDAQINGTFLTAKSIGQISLRAWVDDVPSKEFTVFVDKEPVTDVKFTSKKKSFKHTESLVLEAMAFPAQATFKDIEFSIDESLTDKNIGAKIEDGILTAEKPGTVIVSMKCDGHVYPIIIAVEKEPVIAVSALETNLISPNKSETVFRTSGVLELNALLYPENATNRNLRISISDDSETGAKLCDSTEKSNPTLSKEIVAGERNKVYLTSDIEGKIIIEVTPLDNEKISVFYTIDVEEEPVAEIYFGLHSSAGDYATKQLNENVNILRELEDEYYQFDQAFAKVNPIGSKSFSLQFNVFAHASNEMVKPTSEDYKIYYYTSFEDCVKEKGAIELIRQSDDFVSNNDNAYLTSSVCYLYPGPKMKELWITAVSEHGEGKTKVVSTPMKLTIYPDNIGDIKNLEFDDASGIISMGTNTIPYMSGYEVSVKFKLGNENYGFTHFVETKNTKLGLKLFRYGATPFDVNVNMVLNNGGDDKFEYVVPIGDFHGITGLVPKKQLDEKLDDVDCNYIVFYDLLITSTTFNMNMSFGGNIRYMYLLGNGSDKAHQKLNFTFNNGDNPIGITLHNINFVANTDKSAINVTGNGAVALNVVGNIVRLQGGNGSNGLNGSNGSRVNLFRAAKGANGRSGEANWNPASDIPHGEPGQNGTDGKNGEDGQRGGNGNEGGYGIRLYNPNNMTVNISCADFQLFGGKGGNGGNGGNGSDGQNGGNGGKGGNGSYKFIVVGWRAGHGGDGGDGGNGGNGGWAGAGGSAGAGGLGSNSNKISDSYKHKGDEGEPGNAGTPGKGGSGGSGGAGGLGYKHTVNQKDGTPGTDGEEGKPGEIRW